MSATRVWCRSSHLIVDGGNCVFHLTYEIYLCKLYCRSIEIEHNNPFK
jgi:hypothetical protein